MLMFIGWSRGKKTSQKEIYYDSTQGDILVDFIGKFENLEKDFNFICEKIGIDAELPHINYSKRKNKYRDYYTEETRDLIGEYYKEEIELFGYEF